AVRSSKTPGALWAVMIFATSVSYALDSDPRAPALASVLPLVVFWAARHLVYLVVRTPDPGINPERFRFSSLYRVFVPQALLAWIVSLPLLGAVTSIHLSAPLFHAALVLVGTGVLFEGIAHGLARLRSGKARPGTFMDDALARIERHPNYLGEAIIWWGFWCFAGAAGAWWTLPSPLVMTRLALWASRLRPENDSGKARPGYADYVLKTNAFFPARRRN
ncbi:MAG TPA: DUF1295 domain-containing protein, partial [Steroidobacteraceae bacterium]